MNVPSAWSCDTCGREISSAADGYLEWLSEPSGGMGAQFRIVHAKPKSPSDSVDGCFRHAHAKHRSDMPLSTFVGPNGLIALTALLVEERYSERPLDPQRVAGWVDVFRRLHVPSYEEARSYSSLAREAPTVEKLSQIAREGRDEAAHTYEDFGLDPEDQSDD